VSVGIRKGDMVGFKTSGEPDMLIITQVIRQGRFYFCYSIYTKQHSLLVWDPECYFLVCEGVDPDREPDFASIEFNTNLIAALDKLFGFLDDDGST
jgi:hypothetical protein